ncbi:hypothetical protein IID23_00270 [Patescibacteria group bacterium]|nr:hypothetical protein [Patescibacteria group bacterium]
MQINYPIIDLHTHLRNNIPKYTKIAKENGIDTVVYMANTYPPLDNLEKIKKSLKVKRYCKALTVSAITKNLEGKELVEIEKIKPYVVGFSDDGKYLEDLNLLKEILKKDVLVLAHCSPDYKKGLENPELETRYINNYLEAIKKVGGKLHIQHVSKKESVELIRKFKSNGLKITSETCPQYFTFIKEEKDVEVNPPLSNKEDVLAVNEGLADGTIDIIASDYAPKPRKTGIADFESFISHSKRLVKESVLTEIQLKQKLFLNPKKIIISGDLKFF